MQEDKYNELLETIDVGTCSLILGPEFYLMSKSKDDASLKSMSEFINKHLEWKPPFISEDGFFLRQQFSY